MVADLAVGATGAVVEEVAAGSAVEGSAEVAQAAG